MDSDGRLLALADAAAMRRGTSVRSASWRKGRNFAYSWRISGGIVESLGLPDYLDRAPDRAIMEFSGSVIDLALKRTPVPGDAYMEYVTSDAYIQEKRPVFLRRSRNLTFSDTGEHRNIYDSVQRLLDGDLLTPQDLDNTYFSWTAEPNYTRLGYCQQMFRVVAVSSVLDDLSVPEYVLDFVVYHECMHLRQGYRPFDRHPHDTDFHHLERAFPQYAEAEKYLRRIPGMRKGKQMPKFIES